MCSKVAEEAIDSITESSSSISITYVRDVASEADLKTDKERFNHA